MQEKQLNVDRAITTGNMLFANIQVLLALQKLYSIDKIDYLGSYILNIVIQCIREL